VPAGDMHACPGAMVRDDRGICVPSYPAASTSASSWWGPPSAARPPRSRATCRTRGAPTPTSRATRWRPTPRGCGCCLRTVSCSPATTTGQSAGDAWPPPAARAISCSQSLHWGCCYPWTTRHAWPAVNSQSINHNSFTSYIHPRRYDAIWYSELGSSYTLLNAGYTIDSFMIRWACLAVGHRHECNFCTRQILYLARPARDHVVYHR
jgi:hypothetical protein